ncbi:Crp/Fnr family transcriptional regulator [Paenibacillus radicibacter]|uniref:Crp/Fnr family transcriptional regulator n=1 Tax=Paenibacillus radicibacter TaxID=2972488 RepID=UPI00358FA6E9
MLTTNRKKYPNANTSTFSEANLKCLMDHMQELKVPAGSHLFWEGEAADKLYFVQSGSVRITKSSDEGKELILYMYQPGDLLGQIHLFQTSTHGFSGKVVEDTVVGFMNQKDLEVLIEQNNELSVEFMKWMSLNHRITETKLRDLIMYGKPGALCSTLIRLSNTFGKPDGDYVEIAKKLTHTELSNMIGATRESVNRLLNDLRKQDIIDYSNDYILIKNMERLKEFCKCENCPIEICRI